MKKQTIKLNEAQLTSLIKESIKKVLTEGKVVNHKPYFNDKGIVDYKGDNVKKWYKPGERVKWGSMESNERENEEHWKNLFKTPNSERDKELAKTYKDARIHNQRSLKYDGKGNISGDDLSYGNSHTRHKELLDMLDFMGVSVKDYSKMSEIKRKDLWDKYYDTYINDRMRWTTYGDIPESD